ncbi:MAG: hypothetical protein AAGJ18_20655 [Bacteroidota bacterium]
MYFPMGVQSAWIVIPSIKSVKILLANDKELFFHKGKVKDPTTDIEVELKELFASIA